MTSDKTYADPIDVFIGGAGDRKTRLVERYQVGFKGGHKDRSVFYFEHTQFGKALSVVNALPPGHQINLIGHSYGAATAVKIAKKTNRTIHAIIGVDPVNKLIFLRGQKMFENVRRVVTIKATGTENRLYDGNFIAQLGRVFGGGVPAIFESPAALEIEAPFAHYNFEALMHHRGQNGLSASSILLNDTREFYV